MEELIRKLNELKELEYKYILNDVNYILSNNIRSSKEIENLFDRMLNIAYIDPEKVQDVYYILLDYYKEINEEYALEYNNFFLEIIEEENNYKRSK